MYIAQLVESGIKRSTGQGKSSLNLLPFTVKIIQQPLSNFDMNTFISLAIFSFVAVLGSTASAIDHAGPVPTLEGNLITNFFEIIKQTYSFQVLNTWDLPHPP